VVPRGNNEKNQTAISCRPCRQLSRLRRSRRRAKRTRAISSADLKKIEDQEIPKVIKKQEDVGLQCATDGEYRRMFWHFDFYGGLDGVEIYELDHGIQFQGVQTSQEHPCDG
jgi:methionine synthase II (cobalamin-independent)